MALTVVSENIPAHFVNVIARLADEGVPVCVIARGLLVPSEAVRLAIHEAIDVGHLLEMPRDDWPPGSVRSKRGFCSSTLAQPDDLLRAHCARVFRTTQLQSIVLAALLRREQLTKEQLHTVVENSRLNHKDTGVKLVDVVVCHVRKKLKPFGIEIKTLWGRGYMIEHPDRVKAVEELDKLRLEFDPIPGEAPSELVRLEAA